MNTKVLTDGRITVTDTSYRSVAVAGELIGQHASIDRIVAVKYHAFIDRRHHVSLLPGNDHCLLAYLLQHPQLIIDVVRIDHEEEAFGRILLTGPTGGDEEFLGRRLPVLQIGDMTAGALIDGSLEFEENLLVAADEADR
jgi:hypothetical protein